MDSRWTLILIAIAGFVARWCVAFATTLPWFNTDSYVYLRMADGVLAGHPVSAFPNGFPLLISLVKSSVPAGAEASWLVFLNVALSTATIFLVHAIVRRLTGDSRAALVAAALVAVFPNQINYARQILTETPTAFLLAAATLAFLEEKLFLAGAAYAVAAAFRATYAPAAWLIAGCMLVFRRPAREVAVFLGATLLVTAAFAALDRFGITAPADNLSGNLLIAVGGDGRRLDFRPSGKFTPEEADHPWRTYAAVARDRPGSFLAQRAVSLWELWGPWPGPTEETSQRGSFEKFLIGWRFPLLLAALAGFLRGRASARSPLRMRRWIPAIPVLLMTAVHAVFFSTPRFTCAVEPLAIALAALAFADWRARRAAKVPAGSAI